LTLGSLNLTGQAHDVAAQVIKVQSETQVYQVEVVFLTHEAILPQDMESALESFDNWRSVVFCLRGKPLNGKNIGAAISQKDATPMISQQAPTVMRNIPPQNTPPASRDGENVGAAISQKDATPMISQQAPTVMRNIPPQNTPPASKDGENVGAAISQKDATQMISQQAPTAMRNMPPQNTPPASKDGIQNLLLETMYEQKLRHEAEVQAEKDRHAKNQAEMVAANLRRRVSDLENMQASMQNELKALSPRVALPSKPEVLQQRQQSLHATQGMYSQQQLARQISPTATVPSYQSRRSHSHSVSPGWAPVQVFPLVCAHKFVCVRLCGFLHVYYANCIRPWP
jgi:hypothetical protein